MSKKAIAAAKMYFRMNYSVNEVIAALKWDGYKGVTEQAVKQYA